MLSRKFSRAYTAAKQKKRTHHRQMSDNSMFRFNTTFNGVIESILPSRASKDEPITVDPHHPVAKEVIFTVKETKRDKGLSKIIGSHGRKKLILQAENAGHVSNYEAKSAELAAKKKVS